MIVDLILQLWLMHQSSRTSLMSLNSLQLHNQADRIVNGVITMITPSHRQGSRPSISQGNTLAITIGYLHIFSCTSNKNHYTSRYLS